MSDRGDTSTTVVVVVRDHYSSTARTVGSILATTDDSTPVIVVAGNMRQRARARLQRLDPNRVRVVGPRQHLVPNVARNIGLDHTTSRFVAFVDNDVIVEDDWLDEMRRVLVRSGATAVRPVNLQRFGTRGTISVHESGGECRIQIGPDGPGLVENHVSMHAPIEAVHGLDDQTVGMLEFHCMLFERPRLMELGGFDPTIESQGEHLDLTLRIRESGGEIRLAARARATVEFAKGVRPTDLGMFWGRWSQEFNERSRERFNAKWGITNPLDAPGTWGYCALARSQIWLPMTTPLHRLIRLSTPTGIAVRLDRFVGPHVASLVLRFAPGWKEWRQGSERDGRSSD